jgi:myo-inositol-1(or 4)-monophosphatase/deoxyribonuclease-2
MTPVATAHRGDSSVHRENTVAAIASAIARGAEIIEIDIRKSKDGHVIVLHDPTLERLWGHPAKPSSLTLAEISELGFGDSRIPTLAAVIELFVGSGSAILIDMDSDENALAALDVVKSSPLPEEQVIWCGELDGMRLIRSGSPTARIWLPWNEQKLVDSALIAELKPESVNSQYSYWDREKVDAVHKLGIKTSAWTIDDVPTMRWAKAIGIDSITTNQLAKLQEVIADQRPVDPLDIPRAAELSQSIAHWAVKVCQWIEPGKVLTKVNPADLVTEVDLLIESHAREMILANFPSHNIVGEEFGGEFDAARPTWYIDPVDGTTNFANRTPWSSLSLSLALGRDPLVAVTIDPWRDKVFSAIKGKGTFVNGQPLKTPIAEPTSTPLAGKVVLTELAGSRPWRGFTKFLDSMHENFCTLRIMGAGTLTLTAVSANYGIGAVIHEFSPIDHLAAALIAREAGSAVVNEAGEDDLFPLSGGVMIVQPVAREALYKVWSESLAID